MTLLADNTASLRGPRTKEKLLAAAAAEFNARGFHGTNTNQIARAAGFAPQTFYRHYADKTEIFIRVYERWQADERQAIAEAMRASVNQREQMLAIAGALIRSHRDWAVFRHSLRWLSLEDATCVQRWQRAGADSLKR